MQYIKQMCLTMYQYNFKIAEITFMNNSNKKILCHPEMNPAAYHSEVWREIRNALFTKMDVFINWAGTSSILQLEYYIVYHWKGQVSGIIIRCVGFVQLLYYERYGPMCDNIHINFHVYYTFSLIAQLPDQVYKPHTPY